MDFIAAVSDYRAEIRVRKKCSRKEGVLSGNIDSEPVGRIVENSIIERQRGRK